jgi:capsular polysaccharide export protein
VTSYSNPQTNPLWVAGIKPWKRWQLDAFLRLRYGAIEYVSAAALSRRSLHGQRILIWAAREPDDLAARAAEQGATLIRMEDGFLRSVGLGSNHVGGLSLVIDELGIYFDPRRASALEVLLQNGIADVALLQRASELHRVLVERGLTKYNIGSHAPVVVGGQQGQLRILVPGQVENDASLRCGSPQVRGNLQLLQRVREAQPEAWIVYKPHPDTEAGTRPGRVDEAALRACANQIVRDVSVTSLFPQIDAVHTMTSLVGFEALLRGLSVTTWGAPFYAGWGLTDDHLATPRRTRKLSLNELIAGTLIEYPSYLHPETRLPCDVETIVEYLSAQGHADMRGQRSPLRRWLRQCRGMLRTLLQR